eukprot:gnl/MRDRNA2_/MRDRNA2_102366_c0_seq1.p1 gnl/MRDRNA2_/MRDRNA2_102366_c0~~gnl/MRDRNA2_/MRDRNA2_102366_c0_seq1.p1  ORF type:complete len:251 (+),score=47.32 gnl/MRDRNA2_/MRDRNA2_102366_c0_seq1:66-818(+)
MSHLDNILSKSASSIGEGGVDTSPTNHSSKRRSRLCGDRFLSGTSKSAPTRCSIDLLDPDEVSERPRRHTFHSSRDLSEGGLLAPSFRGFCSSEQGSKDPEQTMNTNSRLPRRQMKWKMKPRGIKTEVPDSGNLTSNKNEGGNRQMRLADEAKGDQVGKASDQQVHKLEKENTTSNGASPRRHTFDGGSKLTESPVRTLKDLMPASALKELMPHSHYWKMARKECYASRGDDDDERYKKFYERFGRRDAS